MTEANPELQNQSPTEAMQNQIGMVRDAAEKLVETADIKKVYGEPITHGDTVIIPAAEVLAGFAVGGVFGLGQPGQGGGGGVGGGGRSFSRPVAIVVARPNGVEVTPVLDPTKIGLAALTAVGFMLATLARMMRGNEDE